jgi:sarcosine oxidase
MARPRLVRVRSEFVVVGAGLLGLSAAWALRGLGREVTVVEQARVGHVRGGSHGACRIFRLGYEDPAYVMLARQARGLWTELEDASGQRLLHPVPQLTFGPQMPEVAAAMDQAGAACELISAGEAAGRFPGVAVAGPVLVEPDSAVISADRALAALAAQAGQVTAGVRVTALDDDGRRVRLRTTDGDVEARCAIVCAGPWTPGLLPGVAVPGQATLEQVAYLATTSAPLADWPIFVHYGGEFPYGLPVPGSDRYKIGIHHGGPVIDPDHQDHAEDPDLSGRIEQAARTFLPGLNPQPVGIERCLYDNSPDTDFIIDRIGNVVVGCGTSGHGFKFGPLLGQWLAGMAAGQARQAGDRPGVEGPPARFRLGRFRAAAD